MVHRGSKGPPPHGPSQEKTKKASKTLEKKAKTLKNKLVCNADSRLLLALGAPRGGFLA
jgi:hypothetical protein